MNLKSTFITTALLLGASLTSGSQVLTVRTDKPGAEVQPTMYGLFFEDINYAADGGLYAEMVKNRSFEFPQSLMGWESFGNVTVRDDGPFERNPHYVRLTPTGPLANSMRSRASSIYGFRLSVGTCAPMSLF